jgi:predicted transcriptional regulator
LFNKNLLLGMARKKDDVENGIIYTKKASKKEGIAYEMFASNNYTQTEIAEILGITMSTITEWKKKFKWEERKEAADLTDAEILKKLKESLKEELDKKPLNADNVSKLNTAIRTISDRKIMASTGITVLSKFMNYLMLSGKQDIAKLVASASPDFINHLLDHE